jgi:hypothetical protein
VDSSSLRGHACAWRHQRCIEIVSNGRIHVKQICFQTICGFVKLPILHYNGGATYGRWQQHRRKNNPMKHSTVRMQWQTEPWFAGIVYAATTLAVLAVCSDLFNWRWTGFPGNTLWDWMSLLLLPVVLTLASFWFSLRPTWTQRHSTIALSVGGAFTILLLGGYLLNWTWTGFKGNTLWDWLHMLILPVMFAVLSFQLNASRQRAQVATQPKTTVSPKARQKR